MPLKKKKGLIHVYTGNGKGKTTAALGLAFRASGHGWKTLMVCFMKGNPNFGEVMNAPHIPGFTLIQSGLPTFVRKGHPTAEDRQCAQNGLEKAWQAILGETHDLLILDELTVALDYGIISMEEALDLVHAKPDSMELVITGRNAPPVFIEKADIVSEIREIKHPFSRGIGSREGIDF